MTLQNHIHLSSTLDGSPEYSPDIKWKASDRLDIPEIIIDYERSLSGHVIVSVLSENNAPLLFNNWRFTIRVQAQDGDTLLERIAMLKNLNGKVIRFVDNFHANDNADHTSDIKLVLCLVGEFPMLSSGLPYFHVDIELIDASRGGTQHIMMGTGALTITGHKVYITIPVAASNGSLAIAGHSATISTT